MKIKGILIRYLVVCQKVYTFFDSEEDWLTFPFCHLPLKYDRYHTRIGDRKKAHWKKTHRKKAHRKKTHMYLSAWEKSAHGKKRTRINPH